MARLFLVFVVLFTVSALVEGYGGGRGGKKARKCTKTIRRFEACLRKGYKSTEGCISGARRLKKKEQRKCGKVARQVRKCDYTCNKAAPDRVPIPAQNTCIQPAHWKQISYEAYKNLFC